MKTALMLTAALCVLAACGETKPKLSEPGTPERICEDAADADPRVRNLLKYEGGVNANPNEFHADYKSAREDAIRECRRVRTGRPKGGVEKVLK
jgi:hypothetical protein